MEANQQRDEKNHYAGPPARFAQGQMYQGDKVSEDWRLKRRAESEPSSPDTFHLGQRKPATPGSDKRQRSIVVVDSESPTLTTLSVSYAGPHSSPTVAQPPNPTGFGQGSLQRKVDRPDVSSLPPYVQRPHPFRSGKSVDRSSLRTGQNEVQDGTASLPPQPANPEALRLAKLAAYYYSQEAPLGMQFPELYPTELQPEDLQILQLLLQPDSLQPMPAANHNMSSRLSAFGVKQQELGPQAVNLASYEVNRPPTLVHPQQAPTLHHATPPQQMRNIVSSQQHNMLNAHPHLQAPPVHLKLPGPVPNNSDRDNQQHRQLLAQHNSLQPVPVTAANNSALSSRGPRPPGFRPQALNLVSHELSRVPMPHRDYLDPEDNVYNGSMEPHGQQVLSSRHHDDFQRQLAFRASQIARANRSSMQTMPKYASFSGNPAFAAPRPTGLPQPRYDHQCADITPSRLNLQAGGLPFKQKGYFDSAQLTASGHEYLGHHHPQNLRSQGMLTGPRSLQVKVAWPQGQFEQQSKSFNPDTLLNLSYPDQAASSAGTSSCNEAAAAGRTTNQLESDAPQLTSTDSLTVKCANPSPASALNKLMTSLSLHQLGLLSSSSGHVTDYRTDDLCELPADQLCFVAQDEAASVVKVSGSALVKRVGSGMHWTVYEALSGSKHRVAVKVLKSARELYKLRYPELAKNNDFQDSKLRECQAVLNKEYATQAAVHCDIRRYQAKLPKEERRLVEC